MGQFYPQLIILLLGVISFIITLMLTIFINFCCIPERSSNPGRCIIFWWIFFSLFLGVSLSYFILGIFETSFFIDNYPKIIEIVGNASASIKNSYFQFVNNYFELSSKFFSKKSGAFGSFAVIITDKEDNLSHWRANYLSLTINELLSSVFSNMSELFIKNKFFQKCNDINFDYFKKANFSSADLIVDSLNSIAKSLTKIDYDNGHQIQPLGRSLQSILSNFIDIPKKSPLINIPIILDNYFDAEVQRAISSFKTDNNYFKSMYYLVYIVFCLLVILYIFQTIALSMSNSYSRCCVIANQPISMIVSLIIGTIGVVTTSISCSISDLCLESNGFAANFYSGKEEFKSLGLPNMSKELIFNSENNYLYDVLNISNFVNFSQSDSEIRRKLEEINISTNITTFSDDLSQSNEELKYKLSNNDLVNNISFIISSSADTKRKIISSNCSSDEELYFLNSILKDLNQLNFIIQNELPLMIKAIDSFLVYNETNSKKLFISSFSPNEYLDAATLSSSLTSSLFTCPLRSSKKFFCEETGGTFSYFAIFSHFYFVSLIGFTFLLLCRRKNMLTYNEIKETDTNENNLQNKPKQKWENHFITEDSSQIDINSSSDSSFDMFQQSHTKV